MTELRWILLGLGLLLIGGLYYWGRNPGLLQRLVKAKAAPEPVAPTEAVGPAAEPAAEKRPPLRRKPEKVVTLRIVHGHEGDMKSEEAVLALKRIGLVHGKYGIFHRLPDDGSDDPMFSVASLTEPGSFDLAKLQGMVIPGLSLFLTLPGPGDGVARFDRMIETARDLAEDLDGVVLDERGSSWSIQRERYIREEIIQFQHQFGRN
jgi:cell division protein ZipA